MLTLLLLLQTQSPHDALHYDITLIPSDTSTHVLGEVQTTWRLGSTDPVRMQLDSSMRVIRVLVDGKPNTRLSRTRYARSSTEVDVPHQKQPGDSISTRVRYRGFPRDGLIIGKNVYGNPTLFADNWPNRAHYWFPTPDVPGDKATVSFHVQAPLGRQVIANGALEKIDTLPYGHAVWHYSLNTPVPVYTMVVGIGRLARTPLARAGCSVKCVPLTLWSYPEDSTYAAGAFRQAGEMLEYFSGLIGPYPFATLAHVESSTRYGGMENSTAIFYDQKLYQEKKLGEPLIAHETAHQWFGDAVTAREWPHLWLSEGFATYLSALWTARAEGDSAFRSRMTAAAATVFKSPDTERPVIDTVTTDLVELLNSNSYQKGAWVLHQLRGLVGDSVFFSGLRRYYAAYRDSTALSSDFARIMSAAAGSDLDWYFRQALTQPGYPVLDLKWKHKGKQLTLDISQTQKAEWGTYRLPGLELLIDGKSVRMDVGEGSTRSVVDGIARRPRKIEVDPKGWWLLKTNSVNSER